ncbi:MAG: phosphoenolpyruvate--protein phosphotransferase [Clostridiales bacterium]|jgi:phosphotransferase system enzyme I (PtsI)|nr:phosphoenolpyruvate--protein phosphotransferase [Clostridiales bacterium]
MLIGKLAAQGIAIGSALVVKNQIDLSNYKVGNIEKEISSFEKAVQKYTKLMNQKFERVKKLYGDSQAEILQARLVILSDPFVKDEIVMQIKQGVSCTVAVQSVLGGFEQMLSNSGDELTAQRAADVREVIDGLLYILVDGPQLDFDNLSQNTILVSHEVSASTLADIGDNKFVVGIVSKMGGYTSHCAIMARAMGLPAVLNIDTDVILNGSSLIVDGDKGLVIIDPTKNQIKQYQADLDKQNDQKKKLEKFVDKQTVLKSGEKRHIFCNIGDSQDALKAQSQGGEGIGLFRTEFLYMQHNSLPSEDSQFEAYKRASANIKGKPLVVRTLDIGGDKDIPYLKLPKEENPFLGHRAIRYCLAREDVFEPQILAILRASAFGDIRIMLPMISDLMEIRQAKQIIERCKSKLEKQKIAFDADIKVGIMTETASSCLIADILATEVDFFSIGTNDLTQYIMSADRGNTLVSSLCSVFQPAVLRAIKQIIFSAKQAKIEVAMCGEAASNIALLPLLLSWGLDEFSVSSNMVLSMREAISKWTKKEADGVDAKCSTMSTHIEVENYLKSQVKN